MRSGGETSQYIFKVGCWQYVSNCPLPLCWNWKQDEKNVVQSTKASATVTGNKTNIKNELDFYL